MIYLLPDSDGSRADSLFLYKNIKIIIMFIKLLKLTLGYFLFLLLTGAAPVLAQTTNCQTLDFNLAPNYQTGQYSYAFAAADFNDDQKIDVVTTNYSTPTVSVLFGDGVGGFTPPQDFASEISVNTVTTGDLNRDGKPDVIAASSGNNKITVLLGNGQGGFSAP